MVCGVAVGVDRHGCDGAPQWLQTLLIPHVGSPRPTAVRWGQIQGRTTLQSKEEDADEHKVCTFLQ